MNKAFVASLPIAIGTCTVEYIAASENAKVKSECFDFSHFTAHLNINVPNLEVSDKTGDAQ